MAKPCFWEVLVGRNLWTWCLLFKAALNKKSAHGKDLNDNGINAMGIKGLVSIKMSHMSEEKKTLIHLEEVCVFICDLEEVYKSSPRQVLGRRL